MANARVYLTIDSANEKLVGRPRRGVCAALALPIKQTCPPACLALRRLAFVDVSR